MDKWPRVAIRDVAVVFDGPHATPKTVDKGPIFLGISALQDGRINLSETRHVTPEDFSIWTRRVKPEAGDVVFSYETRLGQAAIIPKEFECCLGRRMGLVRADRCRLEPRFFLYYYLSPQFQDFIRSRTNYGATVDRIALTEFPLFPIPLPPLTEQRAIASTLGSLDDKIELNRQMNGTLEAATRALFKDWFVDFGPTRAKMEGRPPYLAPDLWSLFPDRLDEEGRPVGWREQPLAALTIELRRGIGPTYCDQGGIRVVNQKCVRNRVVNWSPAKRHDPTAKSIEGRTLESGDVVINSTGVGTLGRIAQVWTIDEPTIVDSHVTVVRADPRKISPYLLGQALLEREKEIEALGEGSTGQTELSRARLGQVGVLCPSRRTVKAFDEVLRPLVERAENNSAESHTLAEIRDLFLPKLMSGELRVRDVESAFEVAL